MVTISGAKPAQPPAFGRKADFVASSANSAEPGNYNAPAPSVHSTGVGLTGMESSFAPIKKLNDLMARSCVGETLGQPPAPLLSSDLTPAQAQEAMDRLTGVLRQLKCRNLPPLELGLGRNQITPFRIRTAGFGMAGHVYRLDFPGQSFAFKIFRDYFLTDKELSNDNPFFIGPRGEACMGAALPRCRDKADFYFAHPAQGYILSEWIGENDSAETRQGPVLQDVLRQLGLQFKDDKPFNRINGVVVDLGWIYPPGYFWKRRAIELRQAGYVAREWLSDRFYRHPDRRFRELHRLGNLKNPSPQQMERIQTLMRDILREQCPGIQVAPPPALRQVA